MQGRPQDLLKNAANALHSLRRKLQHTDMLSKDLIQKKVALFQSLLEEEDISKYQELEGVRCGLMEHYIMTERTMNSVRIEEKRIQDLEHAEILYYGEGVRFFDEQGLDLRVIQDDASFSMDLLANHLGEIDQKMAKAWNNVRLLVSKFESETQEIFQILDKITCWKASSPGARSGAGNADRIETEDNEMTTTTIEEQDTVKSLIEERRTTIKCAFCEGAHFSDTCQVIKDVHQRLAEVRRKRQCERCLFFKSQGHRCKYRRCRHCQSAGHHHSLCDRRGRHRESDRDARM